MWDSLPSVSESKSDNSDELSTNSASAAAEDKPSDCGLVDMVFTLLLLHFFSSYGKTYCTLLDSSSTTHQLEVAFRNYVYTRKLPDKDVDHETVWLWDTSPEEHGSNRTKKQYYKLFYRGEKDKFVQELTNSGVDVFEKDIDVLTRTVIDLDLRVGRWYNINKAHLQPIHIKANPPKIKIFVIDIETSFRLFRLSDPQEDPIISIAILGERDCVVLANKACIPGVIDKEKRNFMFDLRNSVCPPVPTYTIECSNETEMLERFLTMMRKECPHIVVTYNGDVFDIPFIVKRSQICGLDCSDLFYLNREAWLSTKFIHIDVFYWVKRDSMLPMGQRSLKIVVRILLGIEPDDIHYTQMLEKWATAPLEMIHYNVSDVVVLFALFKRFVLIFLFALADLIPQSLDVFSRSGTGSVCQHFLMAYSHQKNMLIPPKSSTKKTHRVRRCDDSLIIAKSATYVGGAVRSKEPGFFASHHKEKYPLDPAFDIFLRENCQKIIMNKFKNKKVDNILELCADIGKSLDKCAKHVNDPVKSIIIHNDVVSMYPNIAINYSLDPHAIHLEKCDRCIPLTYTLKCEEFNMTPQEYDRILAQFPPDSDVKKIEQAVTEYLNSVKRNPKTFKDRQYVETVYSCTAEKPFFCEAMATLKEKRYKFKKLLKDSQNLLFTTQQTVFASEAERLEAIGKIENDIQWNDKIQLSLKVILNSLYGVLGMPGVRTELTRPDTFHKSMIVAAIICSRGRDIIIAADEEFDKFSIPLNRDTDGTYRRLSEFFPNNLVASVNGSKFEFNFPNEIINFIIQRKFDIFNKNCLEFEYDGNIDKMYFLSDLDGNMVKKKYIIFDKSGKCLKSGMDKRGDLPFYQTVANAFFDYISKNPGKDLADFYQNVEKNVFTRFDQFFSNKGEGYSEQYVLDFITIEKTLSKLIGEYKTMIPAVSAVNKIIECTKDHTFLKARNISCSFIVTKYPPGTSQISPRVLPTMVLKMDSKVITEFFKKWFGIEYTEGMRVHDIIDWNYYNKLYEDLKHRIFKGAESSQLGTGISRKRSKATKDGNTPKKIKSNAPQRKELTMKDFFSIQ